jgi:hypothetical protein
MTYKIYLPLLFLIVVGCSSDSPSDFASTEQSTTDTTHSLISKTTDPSEPISGSMPEYANSFWDWQAPNTYLNSSDTITQSNADAIVNAANSVGVKRVFFWMKSRDLTSYGSRFRAFVAELNAHGISAGAISGYCSDLSYNYGPSAGDGSVNNVIHAIIAYNAAIAPNQKFVAVASDIEIQDGAAPGDCHDYFTNGIKTSSLTPAQRSKRNLAVSSYISLQNSITSLLHAAGMQSVAATSSWFPNYYGEEIYNGTVPAAKSILQSVDEIAVMSYNTNPTSVVSVMVPWLTYAATLSPKSVYSGLEATAGVGSGISYADTAGKQTQTAAITDMTTVNSNLGQYSSYKGYFVHTNSSWAALPH